MGGKIDTRAVGLDVGLAMIRWLTGGESLHYGIWDGLEVTAGNLRAAQEAYTERLIALLPPPPARVLDVGGGAGWTARHLIARGYAVEIVVPSAFLAGRCRVNAPQAVVHECLFEDYPGAGGFDVCLFSESFQYIPLADSLPRARGLLAPGGVVVIADCFRSDAYRGRKVSGPQPGGGHRLSVFRGQLDGWQVTHESEITASVAPSIDLEQGLYHVLGLGVTRLGGEVRGKRPVLARLAGGVLGLVLPRGRRARLMQRLTGSGRTAAAFCTHNHYMIFRLAPAGR
jgi:MPBQ/MSBQ methyltransferase